MKSDNYEDFVEKFKSKLTTDDCYTPSAVYGVVLAWCARTFDLLNAKIERPFFPGGDYQKYDYKENSVVIDNPPFSILSDIRRWYNEKGIKYFLFAPHLTCIGHDIGDTKVITYSNIIYHNKARIRTSFVTNMFEGVAIMTAPELALSLEEAIAISNPTEKFPKYSYPRNVVTVSDMAKIALTAEFRVMNHEAMEYSTLDSQRPKKKSIFGRGYLVTDRVADRLEELKERRVRKEREDDLITEWQISDRERELIKTLG